jgi:flagellin
MQGGFEKGAFRMFSVNTNVGAMAALQSLNATQAALQKTQNEISTGLAVSSAADNPAVYSIANTMQADVSGLAAVQNSLNFGASVLGVASSAQSQISTVLQNLLNTVTQGQQTGMDPATIDNSINQMLANVNQFAQSATFNGVNLIATTGTGVGATNSSVSVVSNVAGSTITASNSDPNNGATVTASDTTGLGLNGLTVNASAVGLSFTNATAPAANDTITLGNGTTSWTFMLSDGVTAPAAFANPSSATQINSFININATDSNGAIMAKIASAMQAQGFGATVDNTGQLVISGNGVTNADSSVSISGTGAALNTVAGSTAAIDTVQAAIQQLNVNSAYIGSKTDQITGMESFTSSLSNALTTGIGALTDANMAAESAQLQSLQTKQSLAIQSLSIANQQPQSIMQLFR